MSANCCEIVSGTAAFELLSNPRICQAWANLHQNCPWATAYQSAAFVMTWYRTFAGSFEPVVVLWPGQSGELRGLLTLARSRDGRELVCAGGRRAEYRTWLAAIPDGNSFIEGALAVLAKAYPRQHIDFTYLAPGTPMEWTRSSRWKGRCLVDVVPRPLMAVGDGKEAVALRKKRYRKRKLEGLERLGGIEFCRLSGREALEAVIDQIIDFYDFRQGATHYDVLPFRGDPKRREFYLELAAIPGQLDVTVLRVGGKLASACLSIRSRDEVVLDVIAHSPALAEYSVGMLHMFHLAASLVHERFRALDLTPGGVFKERLATGYEAVLSLRVSFAAVEAARQKSARVLHNRSRRLLQRAGLLEPLLKLRETIGRGTLRNLVSSLWRRRASVFLLAAPAQVAGSPDYPCVRKNELRYLMNSRPAGGAAGRAFLKSALARMESGHQAYTLENGSYSACGWATEGPARLPLESGSGALILPERAVALYGFSSDSERSTDLLLLAMIDDFRRSAGIDRFYAIGFYPHAQSFERAGFIKLQNRNK